MTDVTYAGEVCNTVWYCAGPIPDVRALGVSTTLLLRAGGHDWAMHVVSRRHHAAQNTRKTKLMVPERTRGDMLHTIALSCFRRSSGHNITRTEHYANGGRQTAV